VVLHLLIPLSDYLFQMATIMLVWGVCVSVGSNLGGLLG
jgi:hypothetical protein